MTLFVTKKLDEFIQRYANNLIKSVHVVPGLIFRSENWNSYTFSRLNWNIFSKHALNFNKKCMIYGAIHITAAGSNSVVPYHLIDKYSQIECGVVSL